jgi:hypothetical protein
VGFLVPTGLDSVLVGRFLPGIRSFFALLNTHVAEELVCISAIREIPAHMYTKAAVRALWQRGQRLRQQANSKIIGNGNASTVRAAFVHYRA